MAISQAQLKREQQIVDDLGQMFIDHVNETRHLGLQLGTGAADGGVWVADRAKRLGLIDAVQSFDKTLTEIAVMILDEDENEE